MLFLGSTSGIKENRIGIRLRSREFMKIRLIGHLSGFEPEMSDCGVKKRDFHVNLSRCPLK